MAQIEQISRRNFLRGKVIPTHHPRLPWAIEETAFIAGCQQCNKCIDVCEKKIIKRDRLGYPFVDFDHDECSFCMKCIDACNEPIFEKNDGIKPWQGEFSINESCLAKNSIYCQSCQDVCESKAIQFNHFSTSIPQPKLNNDACNQCGACVSVCPQDAISFIDVTNSQPKAKK